MVPSLTAAMRDEAQQALDAAWAVPGPIALDFGKTEAIDGVGAALLARFVQRAEAAARPLHSIGMQPRLAAFLAHIPAAAPKPQTTQKAARETSFFVRLGGAAADGLHALMTNAVLASDLGTFCWQALWRDGRQQRRTVLAEMEFIGAQAVPIVGLISFLVGITVALQSAVQLRQFGATVFVVDLIGVSICRELGPLLAAIVVAGRSGAAFAAQIATMVVTEEMDALKTMGIVPLRYVVVPKTLAILVAQPLVSLLACALAIFGAFLVGLLALDIAPQTFASRLVDAILIKDIVTGLIKSVCFGALIALVAARTGFAVRGGADGVGRSTTHSVVLSIFAIIVADALFSFVFYYGD